MTPIATDHQTAYTLRRIPSDLWARVKARAASEGLPVRSILLILLRAYADGRPTSRD